MRLVFVPFFPLILPVLFLACSAALPVPKAEKPSCKPISCEHKVEFAVDPEFTPEQKAAILGAVAAWKNETENRVCLMESVWTNEDALHVNKAETNADLQAQVGEVGDTTIGLFRPDYNDVWVVISDYTVDEIEGITAHELGHALGLKHTLDSRIHSVMHTHIDNDARSWPFVYAHDYGEMCRVRGCKCQK